MKHTAASDLAFDPNGPIGFLHNPMDDGQPQTRADSLFLGREIRIEHAFPHIGRNPLPGVFDGKPHIMPQVQIGKPVSVFRADVHAPNPNFNRAGALADGMDGVGAEVHENLMQLDRIRQHRPCPAIDRAPDVDR